MSSATALLADAETSIKAGEWDQALEQLENLKKDQPGQPEVYEKLAHVLAVRGKFQSVVSTYLELITLLVEADSLEKADGMVTKVLELRPESGEARERRIEIENKRGNVARAVYLSRELARLCIDQGDGERSIRLLQDALKHEPGNLDIALELAEMFVSHGHIQDGANQYRKVANAFQAAGNIAKAAEAYRRMKVVQSDDPEVLLTLGRLYTELGKLDEAEQEFRSVLRHDLDHEQALLQLGLVCQLKGRFRSGILAFNKVLQNNPNLVIAKRKLGELHHSQGMMTEAVDFFLQAAQGHLEADVKDEAIECFQIVLSVDENNAPAQQGLTNLGAPVQPLTFEPPQPPTPVEEEVASDPPPPPPVPFASAPEAPAPEPVGGSAIASAHTERLTPINFDAPADPEPPKPEASPKRPINSGSTGTGGGGRRPGGLLGGLSRKDGLIGPGGDKPMLGGEKPTLGRPGGLRQGLGQKSLGGGMMMPGPGGDKPMLGAGGPDRRPTKAGGHRDPHTASPVEAPRNSFADQAPIEEFSADMAYEDVFAEPPTPSEPALSAMDDDFSLPDPGFFDDAGSGTAALSIGQGGSDLFDSNDDFSTPRGEQGGGPVIGAFSGFDSDEDSGSDAVKSLRPDYAQDEPAGFGQDLGDDLFDFPADPGGGQTSLAPTLSVGGLFDDNDSGDDLFGDQAGGGDLFGDSGSGMFDEEESQGSLQIGSSGLFDDEPSGVSDQGLFEGDSDPFANIFDDPGAVESESASETIGGPKQSASDLFFDDDPPAQEAVAESSFDSLFDGPETQAKSIPISVGDDLFGADDDFFAEPDNSPQAVITPTITAEPDDGLFSNDGSNDLFGDDEMFSGAESSGLNPGFSNPVSEQPDLFDSPVAEQTESGLFSSPGEDGFGSGLDAPLDGDLGFQSESLFGDDSEAGGLFEAGADDGGLFQGDSQDLFGGDEPADSGLFGDVAPMGIESGEDDFAANGAPFGDPFEADYSGAHASDGGGLFEDLDSGSDTLFEGFDGGEIAPAPAPLAPDDDLFGDDGDNGLFGNAADDPFGGHDDGEVFGQSDAGFAAALATPADSLFGAAADDGLFGDPEPVLGSKAQGDEFGDQTDGGSLFGDYASQEDSGDARSLPLETRAEDNLFGDPEDEGSIFDLPSPDAEARSFEEQPAVVSAEEPEYDGGGDGLFGNDSDEGGLFGSQDIDEPLPLDLDLPMPGDPPMFSDSAEEASTEIPQDDRDTLFDDSAADLFSAEPGFAAPVAPEPTPEPEPEPIDPEFMMMLELTMPKTEEEPPAPEPEPILLPELSLAVEQSSEIEVDFDVEDDLFESSLELAPSAETPEPAPVYEDPEPPEPDPEDLLSAEEKAEIAQTAQADALDANLIHADAASKIAAYRKSLEENPDNLVLRTRLADIHLKFGLLEDAVVQYRQVMRRNPDSIPLLHRVIQAEFWNENYVEAGDSLLALAHLHLKRGEQHEALDTLQSVLSLDPLHFEARKELVSVFTALDDSKLAAHHLRQLAETALTKGEVAGAISAFQQLLEISADPTFEERLAQIYESQGDVAKALSSFQSLVGRYRAEERWEEAARVTERIVELDPSQLGDREALIALYQRLGQAQLAVEQQFQLARRYQERNETEPAISLYEEVLKYQVDNHDARRHLVDAYLDAGRVSAALEQAEALTEHYLDTKDHTTAIYLYSRLVNADSENVELQERLVKFYGLAGDPENAKSRWVHISNLHEQKGRYDKAAEAVQKALELDESQIELQHRLALLYAERLGDNQAALAQLRKLFHMAPDRMDAVKMYIDLLLKEEQVSEAGQVLQRLEQAGGESVEIKSNVIALLKASVEGNPNDLKARFNYGELCYHLGDLDHAIEQFQQTRRHPDFELMSYNMLGLCFASKRGYMMLDLAINQFKKGLETKGRPEQDYLEIRYNLAMVQYQNSRASEALANLKECYNVDIAFRDVRSWIQKIEGELASGS